MDEDLAELVDRACWQFDTLTLLVTQRSNPAVETQILVIDPTKRSKALSYESTIVTSLAHSYIFNARRMYRIIHGDKYFRSTIARLARRSFDSHMRKIIEIRDINEHVFDPRTSLRRKRIATTYRDPNTGLEAGSFFRDETGLQFVTATAQLLVGDLNLTQAHLSVMRMHGVAGPEMLVKRRNHHINSYPLLLVRQHLIQVIASRSPPQHWRVP